MILKLARAEEWVTFKTSNNALANLVRLSIKPDSYRKFDKSTGQWYCHRKQVPFLIKLVKKYYDDVDTTGIPNNWLTGAPSTTNDSYATLFLTNKAPMDIVKTVYEILVTQNHPDHNDGAGNSARLQEVIAAYRDICKQTK